MNRIWSRITTLCILKSEKMKSLCKTQKKLLWLPRTCWKKQAWNSYGSQLTWRNRLGYSHNSMLQMLMILVARNYHIIPMQKQRYTRKKRNNLVWSTEKRMREFLTQFIKKPFAQYFLAKAIIKNNTA